MKILFLLPQLAALASICALGCKTAKVTSEQQFAPPVAGKPVLVYVANFEIGTVTYQDSPLSSRPGPIGRVGDRLSGAPADPAARARQLVELMAESLVKEFTKSGFNTLRLPPGSDTPANGWLVRGAFTTVDEGNRVRRAMIGFGEGETDLQVMARLDDLSQGPPKPLYEIVTEASTGQGAGAAPTLVLGPYGAAARFVMADKDLEKNVKQTASQIAAQMTKRFQQAN